MSDISPVEPLVEAGENETTAEKKEQPLTEQPGVVPTEPDNWQGDKRYFQTGKKAGTLKPSADKAAPVKITGINFGEIQQRESTSAPAAPPEVVNDRKAAKQHKQTVLATMYSKTVMRFLDAIVDYISGGEYGSGFNVDQRKQRNEYREELEKNWVEYLQTLDLVGHPALVVLAGSAIYVMPALSTIKGEEKTAKIKEKVFGKIGMALFSWMRRK